MTFLAPAQSAEARTRSLPFVWTVRKPPVRRRDADEDGARRALGSDHDVPAAVLAWTSIEDLARIALG